MPVVVDSYSESNWDTEDDLFIHYTDEDEYERGGQSFTGDGGVLNSVKLYLRKEGSPTGNVVVKIYAHSGTYGSSSLPTGSALAISDNIDSSTLPESIELITFTFSGGNKINLGNGTNYVLTIEGNGVLGDTSNAVYVGCDQFFPTHDGNFCKDYVGEGYTWTAYSHVDMCFYVYKDDGSSIKTVGGLAKASVKSINGLAIASVKTINGLA